MESLYTFYYQQLNSVNTKFKRYLLNKIDWDNRLICIMGARGSGKTTLMLQHIKETYGTSYTKALYITLDHIWFQGNTLYSLGEQFVLNGGEVLFLDEVHKYRNWSREIKNLYDGFPTLKIVFTGSSILEINKGEADLSRRAVQYALPGLSFREFLAFENLITSEPYSLDDILTHHIELSQQITNQLRVLPHFYKYLKNGYYPYYKENKNAYLGKLAQTINVVLETDLPAIEKIDYYSIDKIKRLLYTIATLSPFTPNITQLSGQIGVSRNSLLSYLEFLDRAEIIQNLQQEGSMKGRLTKPDKIYLGNTNIAYALTLNKEPDIGTIREVFFCNQLATTEMVNSSPKTDFLINGKYTFEIGGKNKGHRQIMGIENAFLALDNIEAGYSNKIPLWLFGFLY